MHWLLYSFYVVLVGAIRVLKWFEFQLLLFLTPFCKSFLAPKFNAMNVAFIRHNTQDEKLQHEVSKQSLEGNRKPVVPIQINDDSTFASFLANGVLGVGESFTAGHWDVFDNRWEDLTEFTTRMLEANLTDVYYYSHPFNIFFEWLECSAFNLQTRKRAFQVGKVHYDLGNDLYEKMLDPWLQYTCAYWKDAKTLEEAQIAKMEMVARKLDLQPGMRVLDVGCGWGTLCKYLAANYQVECVGVTIGKEGAAYGKRACAGLPVDIRVQDYRELNEQFDRVVSIGCMEHVGEWNYTEFLQTCHRCLKEDGIFLLHSIGRNHYNFPRQSIPWMNKYIFPNGSLPSPIDITKYTKGLFVIEDWHNFGLDYAKTIECWRDNFVEAWPTLENKYGGKPFFRMWIYYLSASIAGFKSRRLQLWQVVLSKDGLKREYRAAR